METNQCLDNMARKENEKVGIFNCHGMGGNQVSIFSTALKGITFGFVLIFCPFYLVMKFRKYFPTFKEKIIKTCRRREPSV